MFWALLFAMYSCFPRTPFQNINSWAFNSFELNEVTDGHALKYIGFEIFNRYGFLERFKVSDKAAPLSKKYANFSDKLSSPRQLSSRPRNGIQ